MLLLGDYDEIKKDRNKHKIVEVSKLDSCFMDNSLMTERECITNIDYKSENAQLIKEIFEMDKLKNI